MNDTPLIWTARGNVPVDSLTYEKEWVSELQTNGDTILWLHERWKFADGELAKNNAHGYVIGYSVRLHGAPNDVRMQQGAV